MTEAKLNPSINDIRSAIESAEAHPCGLSKHSTAQEIANALEGMTLWGVLRGLMEDFGGREELMEEIASVFEMEDESAVSRQV